MTAAIWRFPAQAAAYINSVPQSCHAPSGRPQRADDCRCRALLATGTGCNSGRTPSGYVTGIRFYKSAAKHRYACGNLWSSSGALLASATFTGRSVSAGQQVSFSNPVAVTANTVYVASYHTTVGTSVRTRITSRPPAWTMLPCMLWQMGAVGRTACTRSPPPALSRKQLQLSNFWVDVVFNFNAGADPPSQSTTSSLPNGTHP